jgi:hypothetical protein
MATGWIYVLGEREGRDIKVGYTASLKIAPRVKGVIDGWNGQRDYVVLAGIRGTRKDEAAIHNAFRRRTDLGSRTEYLWPDDDLVEYVNWLRAQYFVSADGTDEAVGFPVIDPTHWLPDGVRRRPRPADDPDKLVQDHMARTDHLGGSAWTWMVNPTTSFQDYFTPSEIINAARDAMGGIDLDAASHWAANRVHRIPDFFDVNRSAFENPWHGRVWLNPPYGDNAPWFREIERYVKASEVKQLCMISPVWAFTTSIARPVMQLSSAFVLLSPTPKFWGNAGGKTGTNNPHGVLYIGDRRDEFLRAFTPFGLPMSFPWDVIDQMPINTYEPEGGD